MPAAVGRGSLSAIRPGEVTRTAQAPLSPTDGAVPPGRRLQVGWFAGS